jgi:hypothetical protein
VIVAMVVTEVMAMVIVVVMVAVMVVMVIVVVVLVVLVEVGCECSLVGKRVADVHTSCASLRICLAISGAFERQQACPICSSCMHFKSNKFKFQVR